MKDPQANLPLFQVAPDDPNVAWLESYLQEHREWMTAKQILVVAGKEGRDERWVRALAQESAWVISGQKGYKHLDHATGEDVCRFVEWMESQAKKMIGRAERMRRNAHSVLG